MRCFAFTSGMTESRKTVVRLRMNEIIQDETCGDATHIVSSHTKIGIQYGEHSGCPMLQAAARKDTAHVYAARRGVTGAGVARVHTHARERDKAAWGW